VPDPIVRDDAVLVTVRAAAANPYDWHFIRGEPRMLRVAAGWRGPKRTHVGVDFSGVVEAVGTGVTRFQPGTEVFGTSRGTFAERLSARAASVVPKPANLTFEQAAAVPLAGLTALQGLRDAGQLRPAQRVLIIGASGGVGTFAVQIAKSMGAHVTGACSARNVELVRGLGADRVVDYTREEVVRSGDAYDLIFQLAGMLSPAHCRRGLAPTGRLVLCAGDSNNRWVGPLGRIVHAAALSRLVSQTLLSMMTKPSTTDLEHLAQLVESGALTPVIDRTYPLSEAAEAIRYLEQGHARGKVVITVSRGAPAPAPSPSPPPSSRRSL
jgi:NADPH:quinone reductase-like Zn-dependent oxidoreductase